MCKWKRTKEQNQQTDLKTEYPYFSCLHKVTFKMSPFECSNSNLVHQQNTIKQLFKLHSSKFTLLSFQHNFLRVKSLKSGVIRSFYMKFRKKSGIAQILEKSGIIRKCLTDWSKREKHHLQQILKGKQELSLLVRLTLDSDTVWLLPLDM